MHSGVNKGEGHESWHSDRDLSDYVEGLHQPVPAKERLKMVMNH
jgi:hypothetical protein